MLGGAARPTYDFELQPANFYVDNMIVTARTSSVGAATVSKINRTAIDHLQANSPAEILSLIHRKIVLLYIHRLNLV